MRVLRQFCLRRCWPRLPAWPRRRTHDPQKLAPIRVQDLQYGDVLFHYYQQDDFEALTRLLAYQHWNQLPHHELDSQLLLGGLYLSLGLYNEAGERFSQLLTPNVPQGVRNRAWFYLGQIWYARGYLDKAVDALRQVQGQLPAQQEAQKVHLLANALLRQGHFDEAIALLQGVQGPAGLAGVCAVQPGRGAGAPAAACPRPMPT